MRGSLSISVFNNDTRGVSEVVGFVVLFGFLIIALAGYQAEIVPQQNSEVEFQHFQEIQNDMIEVRSAISTAGQVNIPQYPTVALGTNYPPRLFALNPPAPAGTLRTTTPYNMTIDGVTVQSRFLEYRNGYNELRTGSLWYDNSVVYLETETGSPVIYASVVV